MINTRVLAWAALAVGASVWCSSAWEQNALPLSGAASQGSATQAEMNQLPNTAGSTSSSKLQRMPHTAPRMLPPGKPISIDSLLIGVNLSDEQKPRIEQARKDMQARMDIVVHDKNENADQKQAMLEGLQRLELREVFLLLTPDQRIGVKNKIAAQRAAEQQEPRSK